MKKSELLSLLAMRVGNRTDADIMNALSLELTLAQNTALEQNGKFKPWFLVTEQAQTATKVNEQRVLLPADYLGDLEEGALYVLNPESGKYDELGRDDYDFLAIKYKDAAPSLPKEYSMESDKYYRLFPTPNAVYTLRQRYIARDQPFTEVADGGENKWLKFAPDWLMAAGGMAFSAWHLQNPGLAQTFQVAAQLAESRVFAEHEMREHANRDYNMGAKS